MGAVPFVFRQEGEFCRQPCYFLEHCYIAGQVIKGPAHSESCAIGLYRVGMEFAGETKGFNCFGSLPGMEVNQILSRIFGKTREPF